MVLLLQGLEEPMNTINGLHQLAPLMQTVASWLEERRLARRAELFDGMPDYLLSDIGLAGSRDDKEAARRAVMLETLRRF
jgi:hypothetical protein